MAMKENDSGYSLDGISSQSIFLFWHIPVLGICAFSLISREVCWEPEKENERILRFECSVGSWGLGRTWSPRSFLQWEMDQDFQGAIIFGILLKVVCCLCSSLHCLQMFTKPLKNYGLVFLEICEIREKDKNILSLKLINSKVRGDWGDRSNYLKCEIGVIILSVYILYTVLTMGHRCIERCVESSQARTD